MYLIEEIKKNDTILIHGGASGIGTTAIQLANSFGARVFTTVGNEEKCNKMKDLGAELAINYNKDDFEKIINEYTNNEGINIILDIIGANYFNKNLNILSKNGKLLIIAFQGGYENKLNLLPILKKWLTVTGSTLRPRSVEEKGLIANQLYEKVWPLIEKNGITSNLW